MAYHQLARNVATSLYLAKQASNVVVIAPFNETLRNQADVDTADFAGCAKISVSMMLTMPDYLIFKKMKRHCFAARRHHLTQARRSSTCAAWWVATSGDDFIALWHRK